MTNNDYKIDWDTTTATSSTSSSDYNTHQMQEIRDMVKERMAEEIRMEENRLIKQSLVSDEYLEAPKYNNPFDELQEHVRKARGRMGELLKQEEISLDEPTVQSKEEKEFIFDPEALDI